MVGAGVIGSSWSFVFARAGLDVFVHDAVPGSAVKALDFVRTALSDLEAQGLASTESPDAILARIKPTSRLEDALEAADYVQESAPERVEVKRELYARLDSLASPDTILASSTSGLPASAFTQGLAQRRRCLVVHPINPPHLIPLVEIVPAPWTDPGIVERATDLMRRVGQSPIRLRGEINGFVVNRLQSALLAEAFRLVEDGVVTADEVDRAVSDGLGLRWFFMGPFKTIDLNAKTGIAEYCRNLGAMYHGLAKEQADPRPWGPKLVETIERQLRDLTPSMTISEQQAWRDRCLAKLTHLKEAGALAM
ncbi:MAG: 3-hydroxyacyl-CoA dehydrogenase [Roseiarcus sp.]